MCFFFFKQKTAYELRISDWSSDVCSSDRAEGAAIDDAGTFTHGQRFILDRVFLGLAAHRVVGSALPGADIGEYGTGGFMPAVQRGQPMRVKTAPAKIDRKSVVWGKSVAVRLDHGGPRIIQQKKTIT